MTEDVRIPSRYCGPPDSANGGYTCGIVAGAIGGSNVEVTLHAPPPVDRTMGLRRDGAEATLVEGGTVIATARPAEEPVDIPADAPRPPAYEDVAAAAAIFDVDAYRHRHEYPTCFTCGPDRAVGDGLRIFPAPTDRADRRGDSATLVASRLGALLGLRWRGWGESGSFEAGHELQRTGGETEWRRSVLDVSRRPIPAW